MAAEATVTQDDKVHISRCLRTNSSYPFNIHHGNPSEVLPGETREDLILCLNLFFQHPSVPNHMKCFFAQQLQSLFPNFDCLLGFYNGKQFAESTLLRNIKKLPYPPADLAKVYREHYDDGFQSDRSFFFVLEDCMENYVTEFLSPKFDPEYPGFGETLSLVGALDHSGEFRTKMILRDHYYSALRGYLEANQQDSRPFQNPNIQPFITFYFGLCILANQFQNFYKQIEKKLQDFE